MEVFKSDSNLRDNKDQQFDFHGSLIDEKSSSVYSSDQKLSADKDYFIDSFDRGIEFCGEANFISRSMVPIFEEDYFYPLAYKLEIFAKADPEYVKKIALILRQRLMNIDTDHHMFPEYELELLDIIVLKCSEEADED